MSLKVKRKYVVGGWGGGWGVPTKIEREVDQRSDPREKAWVYWSKRPRPYVDAGRLYVYLFSTIPATAQLK